MSKLKEIFGEEVTVFEENGSRRNVRIETALVGKKLVAVLMGAQWCPHSTFFIQQSMLRFYQLYQTHSDCKRFFNLFEVIFASGDLCLDWFTKDMPWLVLPQIDQQPCDSITIAEKIAEHFKVDSWPALLLLDPRNGNVLCDSTAYMTNFGDSLTNKDEEVPACVDLLERWEGIWRRNI